LLDEVRVAMRDDCTDPSSMSCGAIAATQCALLACFRCRTGGGGARSSTGGC